MCLDDVNDKQFDALVANVSNDERQAAAHRHDHRMLHHRWDDDGCLLLTARLTPDQGALVVEALDAAAEALQQDRPEVDDSNGRPRHDNDLTDARTELEVSSAM